MTEKFFIDEIKGESKNRKKINCNWIFRHSFIIQLVIYDGIWYVSSSIPVNIWLYRGYSFTSSLLEFLYHSFHCHFDFLLSLSLSNFLTVSSPMINIFGNISTCSFVCMLPAGPTTWMKESMYKSIPDRIQNFHIRSE